MDVVGALIRDQRGRVFAHRRSPNRRLLPGAWDIVGGHVEAGETPLAALAREITEETGWRLRRVEAVLADWAWEFDGWVRRELDYLVEVDGDLDAPRLEAGKHDAYAWAGPDDLELLTDQRLDGDDRLRDVVAKAVRTRLTERLRLEPIGPEHADDLVRLHADETIAYWYAGSWTIDHARKWAHECKTAWDEFATHKWIAYERNSGDLVGRGGISRMASDREIAQQIEALLPAGSWSPDRLELGWAIRHPHRGHGLATELGRAGLAHASTTLGARQVVAFTERHNHASRAVMERLDMRVVGEVSGPGLVEGHDDVRADAPFAVYATCPSSS